MPFIFNTIYQHDARLLSEIIPSGIVDVTITSPPYFDMKDYGYEEQIGYGQTYEDYLDDLYRVFEGVYNCTKEDGTLWVIIDTLRHNGEMKLIPFDFANKIAPIGWKLKEIIIWKKDKTVPWTHSGQMRNAFEYILLFSKNDSFRFDINQVKETGELKRWWIKYPERYHPQGRTPEDVWEFPIPVQGSWGSNYVRHFCPLPEGLIERILRITTNEGDVVFDPFAGSGAVLSKADFMHRRYIGTELNPAYINMFKEYDSRNRVEEMRKYDAKNNREEKTSFNESIINLRILKFARVLFRNINHGDLMFIIARKKNNTFTLSGNKQISAEYTLVVSDLSVVQDVQLLCNEIIAKPPLSKFGILADVRIVDTAEMNENPIFTYTRTNSYKYFRAIDNTFLPFIKRTEVVLSPICVDFNEKDYE